MDFRTLDRFAPSLPAWQRYGLAVALSLGVLLLKLLLAEAFEVRTPFVFYTLAVLAAAWYGGVLPGLTATIISTVTAYYFFLLPYGAYYEASSAAVEVLVFLIQSAVVVWFVSLVHQARGHVQRAHASLEDELEGRRHAEGRLRTTVKQLETHVENTPLAVVEFDPEFRITRWNSRAEQIFGWTSEEVLGQSLNGWRWVHPDDHQVAATVDRLRNGETGVFCHNRNYRKDGSLATMDWYNSALHDESGRITSILSIGQDVTERARAEAALRESEQKFRNLADSMPQLVWTARPDGAPDYYNERRREYMGIEERREGEYEWAPVVHPADLARTVKAWQDAVASGGVYEVEHRVHRADGSFRWHLSRGLPVRDDEGNIIRWFGTATDIHEQKRIQQEIEDHRRELQRLNQTLEERVAERTHALERLNRQLEQRNHELEQFAHVTSHDLQEPLRKITSFGDMLEAEYGDRLEGSGRDYLNRMTRAAERMSRLINDILALSRITHRGLPFRDVDLNDTLEGVLSDLEIRLRETNGVVEASRLPVVRADPSQMHLLLLNLIGNALKFHRKEAPPVVKVDAAPAEGGYAITVADNGIGFEEQYLDRIFTPFVRLHGRSAFEGSGIGLATCRRIVERHGGAITARSTPGQGSLFTAYLPEAAESGDALVRRLDVTDA